MNGFNLIKKGLFLNKITYTYKDNLLYSENLYNEEDILIKERKYFYNSSNYLTRIIEYKDTKPIAKTELQYDRYDNLISIFFYDSNDKLISKKFIE